ncbi:MAG: DUF554 domain-containing protein [Chloroflexi bacterium]|nr:DUF554 domain-containing protein [Chloroflexota bacterium]
MRGTLINTATVLLGGSLGLVAGQRIPVDLRALLFQVIGLVTIVIGVQRAIETTNVIILLGSVVIGAVLGQLLQIEYRLQQLGDLLNRAVPHPPSDGRKTLGPDDEDAGDSPQSPSRGFVTASLIFCVGPMTILGSIQDGLTGAYETLALKATLDGVTSVVLASTLGWGVMLAAGTVLVFQGALTLSAGMARDLLSAPMITEMTATGGLLILAIGLNILRLTRVPVGDLLPALLVAPTLVALSGSRGG